MTRSQPSDRRAVTLVELLVVIAVLAVLMSLLTLGIQRMRETSLRSACAENLKRIGRAFQVHEDRLFYFPDAGRVWTDGRSMTPSGLPAVTPDQNWGCWYQILPYSGYEHVWSASDQGAGAAVIPHYFCPARRAPTACPGVTSGLPDGQSYLRGAIDYAGNGGNETNPIFPGGGPDFAVRKNGTVVPRKNAAHVNSTNIPDGASNTMLVSERNYNLKHAGNAAMWDENNGYIDGWDWDTIRWAHDVPAPDRYDDSYYSLRFGSSHPRGLNLLLADGSVRFMQYGIDLEMFQRLCDRADGLPLTNDFWYQ